MLTEIKSVLIGKPLKNEELAGEKFNVFWGLPILSSDAISSVAYAGEEILWILIPAIGVLAYKQMFYIALSIVALLSILVFSYRQTIDSYPNGGGSYIVAKDNLGDNFGLTAGASLLIDYILTVAVSVCAGTAAITSAVPSLLPYTVVISVAIVILMTIGNLRGIRESSHIFGVPTYLFIISMITMIIYGLVKVYIFGIVPAQTVQISQATGNITLLLLLKAFSRGCTALTGVEAVSNGIPNFREPSQKNAKRTLFLLAATVLFIFGGTSLLATVYHAVPQKEITVLSQITEQVFGKTFMYYVVQITTMLILTMAANTAFSDLPLLLSIISKDRYMPRQFTKRGSRLSFANGIILLGLLSSLLIVIFRGETHLLLPLYAVGVFISFTLSQSGMFIRWIRLKSKGWRHKALINGLGALVTFVTVINIGITRFVDGAWIIVLLIPTFVILMKLVKHHYDNIAHELTLSTTEIEKEVRAVEVKDFVIVPIDSLNKSSFKALNYARHLCDEKRIVALHVSTNLEEAKKLQAKWKDCGISIKLVVKYSPYRDIVNTLVKYVESQEHESKPGDIITVVISKFLVRHWWENIFHNQTSTILRHQLLKDRHIAVVTVPYVLDK
ncbi:APC family permease [Clostridium sp. YIM B02515]|uniref:APC family permease n=1 Tax=Clostridium rhizosphaerae TaxID=2803861 RepID=A0ABS1TCG1_9CLOT|nr:APC family permease [Clostridium rhizosphaerae]MBL4937050.1 APC family permease [Clostridium rhizosphaerae]